MSASRSTGSERATYSPVARTLHWLTVGLVVVVFPMGAVMHYRGSDLNIWDGVTNTLFSSHKLLGFIVLWLVVARLVYRIWHGAPADEPTLEPWQRSLSRVIHWAIYILLIAVASLGWIGTQLFPALLLFDLFSLPGFLAPDNALSKQVIEIHGFLAYVLLGLVSLHIAAALFHHFVRKDRVLERMLPALGRRR